MGVTYDTGALVAGERNDRRMWAIHAELLRLEVAPVVPAPVLAQAWRGGPRQASLVRMLRQCVLAELTPDEAKEVGALLAVSATADVVDAAVVQTARRNGDTAIVTSDPHDLRAIADSAGFAVHLEEV